MALTGNAPYQVTFTDTSTPDGEITAWSWDFGDGDASTSQNPTHTYSTPGAYTVSLNVASDKGTDLESDTVTVYEQADDATITLSQWIDARPTAWIVRIYVTDPDDDNLAGYYFSLSDETPEPAEVYKAKSGTGTTYCDVSFPAPDFPTPGAVYTVNVQSVNVHSLRSLNVVTDTTTAP